MHYLRSLTGTGSVTEGDFDPNVKVSSLSGNLLVEPVYVSRLGCEFPCNKGEEGIYQSTISEKWYLRQDVGIFEEGDVIVSKEDIENGLTDEYFVCDCCQEICHVDSVRDAYDDKVICEDCCDDQYIWSDSMNTYIYCDDAFYYEDNFNNPVHYECKSQYGWRSQVTDSWYSDNEERLETEDGYYYAEGEQDDLYWCSTDECWYYSEDNMPEGLIRGYHKRPALHFFGEGPKFFGLELECDGSCADGTDTDVLHIFEGHMDRFYFNSDGSLSHGFEAITHPMSPSEMLKMDWEQIAERMERRYYDNDRDTAGIHIHISRRFFKDEKNIGRLVRMFSENYRDMVKFAQRPSFSAERWADRVGGSSRQYAIDWYQNAYRAGRYTAVNLRNDETVEIRLFHSLPDSKHIKSCIQLVDVLSDMANIDRYQFSWDIVNRKAKDKGYEDLRSRLLDLNLVEA